MFPKFELDLIESVLKGNNGCIDMALDQLLAISIDDLSDNSQFKNKPVCDIQPNCMTSNDLPPSYSELMPIFKNQQQPQQQIPMNKPQAAEEMVTRKDNRILNKLNSVMIGELPRDFLRVKLNSQQLKLVKKSDEYKDKYKSKNKSKVRITSKL